jgi:hypothetical protein
MIMGFGNGIGSGIVMTLAADISPRSGAPLSSGSGASRVSRPDYAYGCRHLRGMLGQWLAALPSSVPAPGRPAVGYTVFSVSDQRT